MGYFRAAPASFWRWRLDLCRQCKIPFCIDFLREHQSPPVFPKQGSSSDLRVNNTPTHVSLCGDASSEPRSAALSASATLIWMWQERRGKFGDIILFNRNNLIILLINQCCQKAKQTGQWSHRCSWITPAIYAELVQTGCDRRLRTQPSFSSCMRKFNPNKPCRWMYWCSVWTCLDSSFLPLAPSCSCVVSCCPYMVCVTHLPSRYGTY